MAGGAGHPRFTGATHALSCRHAVQRQAIQTKLWYLALKQWQTEVALGMLQLCQEVDEAPFRSRRDLAAGRSLCAQHARGAPLAKRPRRCAGSPS